LVDFLRDFKQWRGEKYDQTDSNKLEHLFREFVSTYDDIKKIEPIFADGVEGRKSLLEVLNALEDVLKKFHDKYMYVVSMYKSNLFYNSPIRGIY